MEVVGSMGDSVHLLNNAIVAGKMGGREILSSVSIKVRFKVGY
jgi:hypothetical protein